MSKGSMKWMWGIAVAMAVGCGDDSVDAPPGTSGAASESGTAAATTQGETGTDELECQEFGDGCGPQDAPCCEGTVCDNAISPTCITPGECLPRGAQCSGSANCCGDMICNGMELSTCKECTPLGSYCDIWETCCGEFICSSNDSGTCIDPALCRPEGVACEDAEQCCEGLICGGEGQGESTGGDVPRCSAPA